MPTENTTPNQGYQLPFAGNNLSDDVARVISAISAIDTDVASALSALAAKAGLASPAFTGTPTAPTAAPGTDTAQLATTAFVKAALDALIGGAPGALDTLNELAAALGDNANFAATITAAIALKANIASVVRHDEAQALTIAQQYQARTNIGAGFGFENRLINPLFQVDIEGNAGGVTVAGSHVVEGWLLSHSTDVTTITGSRVAGDSVPYALRMAVTTGSDVSIAAGHNASFFTAIEGYDIADAKWGTADAKSVWVCGRIKAPTTGVYCVAVRNEAADRSYVFEVECTAGTWVDFEKEIPGDTSGTWNKTNASGLWLTFMVACGSTFHTTADTWSAGNKVATSNQANGLATEGNIFEIEDIRVSVGKPIKTEWRPYSLDLTHCLRFYEKVLNVIFGTYSTTVNGSYCHWAFKVPKRVTPTITNGPTAGSTLDNISVNGCNAYGASGGAGYAGFTASAAANARLI